MIISDFKQNIYLLLPPNFIFTTYEKTIIFYFNVARFILWAMD